MPSQTDLFSLAGAAIFVIGLYGLLVRPHFLHKVLALNIMAVAIFLLLGAIARRVPDQAPDALPHAMVLTGIVVSVAATAYSLALIKRIFTDTGAVSFEDEVSDE
ncbi:MAG: NADH-quinone oxidoreductase subunit K [Actinobacteria bacterium]|nr:NADH-quinone oxidoreductase subunit K [Actinomycetota bacterium]